MDDPVRRENELLTAEVLHLREQLARVTGPHDAPARAEPALPEPTLPSPRPAAEAERAQGRGAAQESEAVADLRWLLGRLEALPVRHLLRRKAGYRRLVEKYLD